MIVDISLDRRYDNPQLIFESLNSTGLELSQADLVRNYVLMGLEPAEMESLYRDYWFPMEQRFGHTEYTDRFNRFMRDYLTVRTGRIPNIDDVYSAFKAYARSAETGGIRDIVAEIARFARYYVDMALLREPDPALREAFEDIAVLKVDVAYPFFLEMYELYASQLLSREDLLAMARLVESYVFRRGICGIPTNSLNKTFANLSKELDPDHRLDSLKAALQRMESYRRFPSDQEFLQQLAIKDVYNFRSRNYLLRKLENAQHKDRVIVENYTIEHILPQNEHLSPAWRQELGPDWQEIQSRCLHRLGNLTLTLYNPELSDRPFIEKRDMEGGFRKTPLALNDGLRELHHWNEQSILERTESLARLASKLWPAPNLTSDTLSKYSMKATSAPEGTHALTDFPELKGPLLELFEELRTQILNLDSSVTERIDMGYITYATAEDFIDVAPSANGLLILHLHVPFGDLYDPTGIAEETLPGSPFGGGEPLTQLRATNELEDVMFLVLQAFDKQREDSGA